MGDGSVKRVGLSLAQQAFVFFLERSVGRISNDTDLSAGFKPRLFHFPHMLFSIESQFKLYIFCPYAFQLQIFLYQSPLFNE